MERNVIFKCPRTGMNVQHWLPGTGSDAADTHVLVQCPACASLHFVNVASGKMLGEGIGRPRANMAPADPDERPDPSRP
ncbi:hypothetical protein HZZ13_07060 [Bradyrhizobium sp. CNPSo 4010]|uniref:Uncharacterized protein n=1 Tax=Bradyrhizobium agreste TaxID=2751811 RepID=A0ABS0PK26_9BRAD|nr:hypothetical protein [Bradyrhizobium agreste]MBH5397552.1 hypothetical protein [Bradyrhizobium agreste]